MKGGYGRLDRVLTKAVDFVNDQGKAMQLECEERVGMSRKIRKRLATVTLCLQPRSHGATVFGFGVSPRWQPAE